MNDSKQQNQGIVHNKSNGREGERGLGSGAMVLYLRKLMKIRILKQKKILGAI